MEAKPLIWIQPGKTSPGQEEMVVWGVRDIRYHTNDQERHFLELRNQFSWPHCKPWSVFIAAMGSHWKPGCWQRVIEMMDYTQKQGFYVALQEIMDRCFQPYDALGCMRNEALMKARQGFEWILYIDNDVMPTVETLVNLLRWDMPVVAPYVIEPGTEKRLHGPGRDLNTGLQPVRWCVLSMLLMRTTVFNAFPGGEFWNDSIGADEGYHFQKLWDMGHRPYLDTNTPLEVYSIPTYPLATNRMTEAEAKSFWDIRREWLLARPDRAPIDPDDPRQEYGEFYPWVNVEGPAWLTMTPSTKSTTVLVIP